MFNWFKKKKATPSQATEVNTVAIKSIDYHPKVIMAWAKAIEGNKEILIWLKENGYPELAMATYAIYLKDEARDWLLANGYPHLLAMINAAEGNENAQKWLLVHGFEMLYHMSMAVENEDESWKWLSANVPADIFLLTQTIKQIKDKIEENHNDIHSFGRDL
jgi:ribosomal protein S15P/S13E